MGFLDEEAESDTDVGDDAKEMNDDDDDDSVDGLVLVELAVELVLVAFPLLQHQYENEIHS